MTPATMKAPRGKDVAAIEAWLSGSTLVDAYREHIARNPDAPRAHQAASIWAKQDHIAETVRQARANLLEATFSDIQTMLMTQLARLDAVYRESMTLRPNSNGVMAPTNEQAALGAVALTAKLFHQREQSSTSKLQALKLWVELRGDLMMPAEAKLRIEEAILAGEVL